MGKKHKTEHVAKTSPEISIERLAALKELLPEVFSENELDVAKLQAVLGTHVQQGTERYTFTWAGKRDAILTLQRPRCATLTSAKSLSVDYDKTHNLFIEGDNLEVLKLLYKPYFGQVKVIYIDPPYNTGKDFVYPDNYTDPLDTYLKLTGQRDSDGNLLTSNPDTNGRFHSAWLSMMYPRLFLARQLLREDGAIFVSIDDNEAAHLKLLMNEVFGEENFLAQLVWENREGGGGSDSLHFKIKHEYIIVYAKNLAECRIGGVSVDNDDRYTEVDEYVGERGKHLLIKLNSASIQYSKSLDYPIKAPDGSEVVPHHANKRACWRWSRRKFDWGVKNGFVVIKKDSSGKWAVYTKMYLDVDNDGKPIVRTKRPIGVIPSFSSTMATKHLEELFGSKIFDYSKPYQLVEYLLSLSTQPKDDIVLDFFAGSCATADAVLEINRKDGGTRRFIMVQLPEPLSEPKNLKDGVVLRTIADVGRERILRVIKQMKTDKQTKLGEKHVEDLGFRTFILGESNYKQWDETEQTTVDKYIRRMEGAVDSLKSGWRPENVIYEVALKEGYGLGITIEKLDGKPHIFRVTDADKEQSFYIDLDDKVVLSNLKPLHLRKDDTFICRDSALDDTTAANLALQCRLKTI